MWSPRFFVDPQCPKVEGHFSRVQYPKTISSFEKTEQNFELGMQQRIIILSLYCKELDISQATIVFITRSICFQVGHC